MNKTEKEDQNVTAHSVKKTPLLKLLLFFFLVRGKKKIKNKKEEKKSSDDIKPSIPKEANFKCTNPLKQQALPTSAVFTLFMNGGRGVFTGNTANYIVHSNSTSYKIKLLELGWFCLGPFSLEVERLFLFGLHFQTDTIHH